MFTYYYIGMLLMIVITLQYLIDDLPSLPYVLIDQDRVITPLVTSDLDLLGVY